MSKITVVDYQARRGDTGSTCTPDPGRGCARMLGRFDAPATQR
jgi:hypothetical protein